MACLLLYSCSIISVLKIIYELGWQIIFNKHNATRREILFHSTKIYHFQFYDIVRCNSFQLNSLMTRIFNGSLSEGLTERSPQSACPMGNGFRDLSPWFSMNTMNALQQVVGEMYYWWRREKPVDFSVSSKKRKDILLKEHLSEYYLRNT